MLVLFFIFRYFAYFILMFNLGSKKKKKKEKNPRAEQCREGLPAGGNARCSSSVQPASLQPPVSSLGHVLTCTSPVLSLRISLMGNPVHSALLPASGVAREGGAGFGALTREAPVAAGTVCPLCGNWSVFPLLLGAGSWANMAFQQALGW